MSQSRQRAAGSSRRAFLKTAAGVAAGTVLTRPQLWAQGSRTGATAIRPDLELASIADLPSLL